jgi:hypothetical protein
MCDRMLSTANHCGPTPNPINMEALGPVRPIDNVPTINSAIENRNVGPI